MVPILDFRSEQFFYLLLIYKSPQTSYFGSSRLAFQFRRRCEKIDFQDGRHGGHLGFPIRTILDIFYLQVSLMLPTKFRVNWPFPSGEAAKNRFSRWPPWQQSWISNRDDLSYFLIYQVTAMLLIKFQVNKPFGSGEEAKNRFSRLLPWQPSWISDQKDFSSFWPISHPAASYQVSSQLAFQFRRRSKK